MLFKKFTFQPLDHPFANLRIRYTLKYKKKHQILFFDNRSLSLKATFKPKKTFPNAILVLEIIQVKVLSEVNKQVGCVISSAFFAKQNLTVG